MLTDSSLTNILTVSGVSQIRYRAYTQTCERSHLLDSLRWDGSDVRSRNKLSPDPSTSMLIKAYRHLVDTGIPSVWRTVPNTPGQLPNMVTLELWVFWFDELHTGKIDSDEHLCLLEEIRAKSFTWDDVYSKNMSPNASPVGSRTRQVLVTVAEEYKLFIKALRNLVRLGMIRRGALPLGHFFVFPSLHQENNALSPLNRESTMLPLLCCTYNVYLARSNLIFQPSTRRMRLIPFTAYQANVKDSIQVILSPSGECATIFQERPTVSPFLDESILRQWSSLLDIPYSLLSSFSLVSLRNDSSDVFLYPAALVFVPLHPKQVPTSMAGMNGVCAHNGGHSETLGEKWWRSTWMAKTVSTASTTQNDGVVDYWAYASSQLFASSTVFDSLAVSDTRCNSHDILQKALSEPIAASPVMSAKSVVAPFSTARLNTDNNNTSGSNSSRNSVAGMDGMSLHEFALSHFASDPKLDVVQNYTPPDEDTEMLGLEYDIKPPLAAMNGLSSSSTYTPPASGSLTSQPQPLHSIQTPQIAVVHDDMRLPFNVNDDMNGTLFDLPSQLDDDMPDIDNFNVTEEDFDFFESRPMADESPGDNISNEPKLMLMDSLQMEDVPVKDGDLDLDELLNMADGLFSGAMTMNLSPTKDHLEPEKGPVDPQAMFENETVTETVLNDLSLEPPVIPFKCEAQLSPLAVPPSPLKQEIVVHSENQKTEQCFVPPEFAPVSSVADVDDTKYSEGGKFMYSTTEKSKPEPYRPDYVPKVLPVLKPRRHTKGTAATIYTTNYNRHLLTDPATVTPIDDESDDTSMSTASSDDSEYSDDSNISHSSSLKRPQSTNNCVTPDSHDDHPWLDSHERAQTRFMSLLLGTVDRNRATKLTEASLDYDSPFASTVACGSLNAVRLDIGHGDYVKALDYLCQQAVMGGYPFAGGLSSLSGNGGEITPGESAKALVTRRRNLIQSFYGDATHVPALPTDEDHMTFTFKSMLSTLFETRPNNVDPLNMTVHGSAAIKGPLNVQQYYDLTETNQGQSKYGKYQIKKRRPAEPNLDTLDLPDIVVGRQDEFIEGSPKLITFWEKLRLEPFSSKKNVSYFVVFPGNDDLKLATAQFFKSLSSVYETCLLGAHHPGNIDAYRDGLAPVPLLPEVQGESWHDRQLRSYTTECRKLGSALGNAMKENMHIVVYLANPASHMSSHLDLSLCFHQLMSAYRTTIRANSTKPVESSRARLVMQLMPMEHILRPNAFGGYLKFGLKEIAFSVYNKCPAIITRTRSQTMQDTPTVAEMYAPAFVLAKAIPDTITYKLQNQLVQYPTTALQQDTVLHLGYTMSLDRRWMAVVWTDSWGELVEFAVLQCGEETHHRLCFDEAWRRTKAIAQRSGVSWTFVIAKLGLIFEKELQAWTDAIPSDANVALVCVDLESPLSTRLDLDEEPLPIGTPGSSMASTPTPTPTTTTSDSMTSTLLNLHHSQHAAGNSTSPAITPTTISSSVDTGWDEAWALVLNHRVAYSHQREQTWQGILSMDSGTSNETWMLPLASGYMIHALTPGSESPSEEQFSGAPLVIESHLFLNQTRHSAYSTLRDIIKRYHALSHVNVMPSGSNCLPIHLVLVERLVRILLMVQT